MSPQTKVPELVVTTVVCLTVSTLFVLARFYSRLHLQVFRVEDWFMTVSWVLNIGIAVITLVDIRYGTGRHTSTLKQTDIVPHLKIVFTTRLIYALVLPITKLSICFLYSRVVDVEKLQKNLIRVLSVYLILTGLGFTVFGIFQCIPVSAYWNDPLSASCLRTHTASAIVMYAITASNIFTDLCIIAIVFPLVWKLQLENSSRLVLNAVVCIGVFSVISSVVRIYILHKSLMPTSDPSWGTADVNIWSCVECNTSLICAAAPCIRPFINKMHSIFSLECRQHMVASENTEEYYVSEDPLTAGHLKDFGHSGAMPKTLTPIGVFTPPEDC